MRALLLLLLLSCTIPLGAQSVFTIGYPTGGSPEVMSLLTKAYGRLGLAVKFVELPGVRSLVAANSGQTDGELHRVMAVGAAYPNLVPVKVRVISNTHTVFSKRSDLLIAGYPSLKSLTIAFTRGYVAIEKGTQGMNVFPVANDEQAFRLLMADRVDVVVTTREDGIAMVESLGFSKDIAPLEPPVEVIDLYHFVNKKHADLVPRLEAELRRLQSE